MIKVALIGCGLVADQHLSQIRRIPGCEIVGLCDLEPLMAQQLADRFHVQRTFTNARELLSELHPDVVHVTTPAQSHFSLGKLCLEAGANVYLEKPFTLNTAEAEVLLDLADTKGLKMTVGHNLQFSSETMRMRQLISDGFLGGPPLHLESIQCFSHGDPVYGNALLGDPDHWVRKLPGSLLHNLISHGIAKLAEFLSPEGVEVIAFPFTSPYLKGLGQNDLVDELRVIIHDSADTTAYFTFSTRLGVAANELRLYGKKNALVVDNLNRMLVPVRNTGLKSFLRYFLGPIVLAKAYSHNSWQNVRQFLRKDFHEDSSLKNLTQLFYQSVESNRPVPIPYREILGTSRIMDDIFAQIQLRGPSAGKDQHPMGPPPQAMSQSAGCAR